MPARVDSDQAAATVSIPESDQVDSSEFKGLNIEI